MSELVVIQHDQCTESLSILKNANKAKDLILIAETATEMLMVKHHKKKLVFQLSVMRHFAERLVKKGYQVISVAVEDQSNSGDLITEIEKCIQQNKITQTHIIEPSNHATLKKVQQWCKQSKHVSMLHTDERFLCSRSEFSELAQGKKQYRMEMFYRVMRKKHQILLEDDKPVGGKWNYDQDNRQPPKSGLAVPPPFQVKPDSITQAVSKMVDERFANHFGDIAPFHYAVTRVSALRALKHFISERLPLFGHYQDAMIEGEAWMFHSHIALYLNCGLILPEECIKAAEDAYDADLAPLNSVEGFIRQILGWREFIRGIYWHNMPKYSQLNFLNANNKLPDFFWSAETDMNCIKQCVLETKKNAYAHHIQRLMILGNFALLAGIHPNDINEWFWIVYADAYQWVELPNVSGMAIFADGGIIGSKPYAASANYINKMSNYCQNCRYKPKEKDSTSACPFNYLYWDFLARNEETLRSNHRMRMIYANFDRMPPSLKQQIKKLAVDFIKNGFTA